MVKVPFLNPKTAVHYQSEEVESSYLEEAKTKPKDKGDKTDVEFSNKEDHVEHVDKVMRWYEENEDEAPRVEDSAGFFQRDKEQTELESVLDSIED